MDTIMTIVGALIFFALILVSVGLHEVGHFVPSKIFGAKVLQFFIGFGKNIWRTHRGETEYGVKMIPLGGYVRLLGSYPPYKEGKNTWLKKIADSARQAEWEEITDEDVASGRLLYQKPVWQRIVIMGSGIFTNLLIAFLIFLGINLIWGQYQTSMTVSRVAECVDAQAPTCEQTPSAAMGLRAGDTLVALNGVTYSTWTEFSEAVKANGANTLQVTVVRDGSTRELPAVDGTAVETTDPQNPSQTVTVGYLGASVGVERVKVGPLGTIEYMWDLTTQSVRALAMLPVTAAQVVGDMITGQPRDVDSPISIVGASVVAGQIAGLDGAETGDKVAAYLSLLASLNLFVGLMNLVPLPPFDGGQIASAAYEGMRRTWARMRGRGDPGPVDTAKLFPVTVVVGGLLVIIGAILIIADIVSPVAIF